MLGGDFVALVSIAAKADADDIDLLSPSSNISMFQILKFTYATPTIPEMRVSCLLSAHVFVNPRHLPCCTDEAEALDDISGLQYG